MRSRCHTEHSTRAVLKSVSAETGVSRPSELAIFLTELFRGEAKSCSFRFATVTLTELARRGPQPPLRTR
jgi:hypothetical protein